MKLITQSSPPPPALTSVHSKTEEELSFFSTVAESRDIDAMYQACLSFFVLERYDRFHLVKISHFLTYDNILDS